MNKLRGNVRQGSSLWQYTLGGGLPTLSLPELVAILREMGVDTVDLLEPPQLQELKKLDPGMKCASTLCFDADGKGTPPFVMGFNNPTFQPRVIENTRKLVDAAAASDNCNGVVVFTGYKWVNLKDDSGGVIAPDEGIANCVAGLKQVVGLAEQRGVTLYLELLNDQDRGHPMKGHPGYQGTSIEHCLKVIRGVGSPRLKLLFDIYHVSLMDQRNPALIIRALGKDVIGHVHTARKADRGETYLDDEVDQPACMQALVDTGYRGTVIHEFLPSVPAREGLRLAVQHCDV
jgi:hydroxypyruvate isomerase